MEESEILKNIAELIFANKKEDAEMFLKKEYSHKCVEKEKHSYSAIDKMKQFVRDGFIDRYNGKRLVNPGILKVITYYFPDDFPYDPHWKMSRTHKAYWNLIPTIDHIIPTARGGADVPENWATTSMKNNSIKSNYSLDEIGWKIHPKGDLSEWDGLTTLFIKLVENNTELCNDSYIYNWYKMSKAVMKEIVV